MLILKIYLKRKIIDRLMIQQLIDILDNSKNKSIDFSNYKSYNLTNYMNVNDYEVLEALKDYVNDSLVEVKIYYNSITKSFNNIGILDFDDCRVIDLDDDNYTMMNKGIDLSKELKIE